MEPAQLCLPSLSVRKKSLNPREDQSSCARPPLAHRSPALAVHRGHLVLRLAWYHAVQPLAVKAQLMKATPRPTTPEQWLSEEEVQRHLSALTATLNGLLRTLFSLSYCDDPALTLKCAGGLMGLAWLSRLLGTVGLFFVAFVGTLGLPKAYELKQPEVDAALATAKGKATELYTQVKAKVPSIPKATDLKSAEDEKKKL